MTPRATGGPESADTRAIHPVHVALVRSVLYAGAEPTVVIVELSISFSLLFIVGFHLVTVLLAGFWLSVVHAVMVWIAKQDSQMIELYVRSLFGRDYYPAQSRLHAPTRVPRPSIPRLA